MIFYRIYIGILGLNGGHVLL